MNYTQEALRAMQKLGQNNPEMSLGDILFTCFQKSATESKNSLNFLREISSEDLYTKVENAVINTSKEDTVMTDEEWNTWSNK